MSQKSKTKYAIFAGGETAGPLMPLLAVAQIWQEEDPNLKPVFVDVSKSVAADIVPDYKYIFRTIITGKLRRYFTIQTLALPFLLLIGLVQSIFLLIKYKPVVVVGAGGYVQIPLIIAAWLMRIPRVIHQQDVMVTLANRAVAPLTNKITTTFESSIKDFRQGSGFSNDYSKLKKVVWVGNPSSQEIGKGHRQTAQKFFKLSDKWPTLLVVGGGSGAVGLNDQIINSLPVLNKVVQIIHSTGKGKQKAPESALYHPHEFIDRMDLAYAASDIVIARAGIGTITELSRLKKVAIIVPMPGSHQEANAELLYRTKSALVVDQKDLDPENLTRLIRKLLFDKTLQNNLQQNIGRLLPHDASHKMLKVIYSVL